MTGLFALLPALLFLGCCFVLPVGLLLRKSFFDPDFTLEHYHRIFEGPLYLRVLWTTFKISAFVTILCLIIGYPFAYTMARMRSRWRFVLLGCVLLPFWTSLLVRTFAFMTLLQRKGVINNALAALNIVDEPIPLVYNLTGVLIGMTYMLLPYMILPIYSVLRRISPSLEQAASGLGAGRIRVFRSIVLPLSLPGVLAGIALVFLLSLGFFVTPALLGGRKEIMLSMLVESQVNELLNWGFASALCVVLLVATIIAAFVFMALLRLLAPRLLT